LPKVKLRNTRPSKGTKSDSGGPGVAASQSAGAAVGASKRKASAKVHQHWRYCRRRC
jgi:hypothetical protein